MQESLTFQLLTVTLLTDVGIISFRAIYAIGISIIDIGTRH